MSTKFKIGTLVRLEEGTRGAITGIFENKHGTFYQLDDVTSLHDFVAEDTIVSIYKNEEIIRKPRRRRERKSKAETNPFGADFTHEDTGEVQVGLPDPGPIDEVTHV